MNTNLFVLRLSGTIFAIVSLAHLVRLINATSIIIGTWTVPVWISMPGFVVTAFLSVWLWRISVKKSG